MIIPSGLSDLSANASSEAIMLMDHDPFHLEYKYNSESAPEGEIVLLHEAESFSPVDISPEDGEEFEGTSDPRSVKLKYRVYHLLVDLGWVDLGFECSTVCRILRGLTGIRHNYPPGKFLLYTNRKAQIHVQADTRRNFSSAGRTRSCAWPRPRTRSCASCR